MRKFIIVLLYLSICMFAFSQEHMKFMGISMAENIDVFTNKLQAKGLRMDKEPHQEIISGRKEIKAIMKGSFWNYMNCTIGIVATIENRTVNEVFVNTSTDTDLYLLKRSLSEKYGTPQIDTGDYTEWILPEGSISVTLFSPFWDPIANKFYPSHISITYKNYTVLRSRNNDL